jgi:hypothetical protein
MPSLPPPSFMYGPCEDLGYLNTRDHPRGIQHKQFVEELWSRFHPLADPHFREDARNHFLQRFWEMYLAVTLLEHGFSLQRYGDEGPEFYASLDGRRIWFEAITPGAGTGPDQVHDLVPGTSGYVPVEKILLRFTHALVEKRSRYEAALAKGIISAKDSYVLAINSRGIPLARSGNEIPYFVQAFLPIGPLTYAIDKDSLEVTQSFYPYRPEISKLNGSPVSTRAFLDEWASFCSAVLHSQVDCANHPNEFGGDFAVLHNPQARKGLDATLFDWCIQYTVRDDQLHRSVRKNKVVKSVGE